MGKTQMAVKFVKEHRDKFSAVFWMNGKNEDALKQSFADAAKRIYEENPSSSSLKAAAESKDPGQLVEAVKHWLSTKGNSKWIVIFDNVDNPQLSGITDPQAYDIKSYFPKADQGFVLITTRCTRLRIGKVISVKKLHNLRESVEILANMSDRQISHHGKHQTSSIYNDVDAVPDPYAVQLAKKLDGLPLALATAGAYLYQVSTSLENYLAHYNKSWMKLQETSPRLESYQDALYSTWNISYEHICSQNESAGKLLRLWGYFDNQDLWYELLAQGSDYGPEWFSKMVCDELSFNEAIRLLCDHGLVESHGASVGNSSDEVSSGYSMHGCVHAWIVHALNSARDNSMAELAFTCVGFNVVSELAAQLWTSKQRLLPHANKCLESIRDGVLTSGNDRILNAATCLAYFYQNQRKFKEAEEIHTLKLRACEIVKDAEHFSTVDSIHRLAFLYTEAQKFDEAEELYQRALTSYEKIVGAEDMRSLEVMNNLGLLYKSQNKLEKAENIFLRALVGCRKNIADNHILALRLSIVEQKMYSEMEIDKLKLSRVFEIYEKKLKTDGAVALQVMCNFAVLRWQQDKIAVAEEMLLQALKGCEELWIVENELTLNVAYNLGLLYLQQKKTTEAEELLLRASKGFEEIFGADGEQTLNAKFYVMLIYAGTNRIQVARDLFGPIADACSEALRDYDALLRAVLDKHSKIRGALIPAI